MSAQAKVCALLSWYDESPIWLAATVGSLAGVADHLVAVDGAYALFPSARARSPVEQHEAIVAAAAAARLGLTLFAPREPWLGNEVEKRNVTLQLAGTVADDGWWLLVIDGDEVVTHANGFRYELAACEQRVATYGHMHRLDPAENPHVAEMARDVLWPRLSLQKRRCLYRFDRSLRYEGAHFVVVVDGDDGGPAYLWGDEQLHPLEPAFDVSRSLQIEHRNRLRDRERAEHARHYYRVRDACRVESLA